MTRLLAAVSGALTLFAGLVLVAPPAWADALGDAQKALEGGPVYVAPGAATKLDTRAATSALGDSGIKVAVLPTDGGDAFDAARKIGERLGGAVTVGVIVDKTFNAASNVLCQGAASSAAKAALDAHRAELDKGNATPVVQEFVRRVAEAPKADGEACSSSSVAGNTDLTTGGGGGGLPWVIGLGLLGLAGVGGATALAVSRRRKRAVEVEGDRAEALGYYHQLGADLQNLDPGDDPEARQALADAADRYAAAGSLLAEADGSGEFTGARHAALEGLQASRTAHLLLGYDPGPELSLPAPSYGEQLSEPQEITVGGQSYPGYPEYRPGAPYYYGGGNGVPGGWYPAPFWETLLLGSVLTGGLGGWGDGGYDAGPGAGQERDDRGGGAW